MVKALFAICLLATAASAQTPSDALRDGNEAAAQGDWSRVSSLVDPLLRTQLPPADLAEAYRLAGIAAFFQNRKTDAEAHFLNYLRIDLDARLDPALYPPDVVNYFNDIRLKHDPELRRRRPKPKRYWWLNLVPPGGQIQNGDKLKAWLIGGGLAAFAITNVTSYYVLRSWCTEVEGSVGGSVTCDDGNDRSSSASTLKIVNIGSGVGLILTYAYGVYDGFSNYARKETIQPFVAPVNGGATVGVGGTF
jgi:hypothetical protein